MRQAVSGGGDIELVIVARVFDLAFFKIVRTEVMLYGKTTVSPRASVDPKRPRDALARRF